MTQPNIIMTRVDERTGAIMGQIPQLQHRYRR
ncbi:Uncharacterised protein [Streptococcus pyogenes]|nr:Uncharacterised protein [Streptococcus pyogenes]